MLKEIVDHKSDESALRVDDGYTVGRNGNLHPKITTQGWKLLCEWKDGSTEWIALKDIKDSYPLEIAEYAVANQIQEEPAFKWWVGDVLCTRNHIIGKNEKQILEDDTQIWDKSAQECSRSVAN